MARAGRQRPRGAGPPARCLKSCPQPLPGLPRTPEASDRCPGAEPDGRCAVLEAAGRRQDETGRDPVAPGGKEGTRVVSEATGFPRHLPPREQGSMHKGPTQVSPRPALLSTHWRRGSPPPTGSGDHNPAPLRPHGAQLTPPAGSPTLPREAWGLQETQSGKGGTGPQGAPGARPPLSHVPSPGSSSTARALQAAG